MWKSRIRLMLVFFCVLLVVGCAPPRQKPNKEALNTGGSDEMDTAIGTLKNLGLDLDLNDISAFGEGENGVSDLLPDPANTIGRTGELISAIDDMEAALASLDNPDSIQAAYVSLYLGYTYILTATSVLQEVDPNIITLDTTNSYHFNAPTTAPTTDEERQALVNAFYILTGESVVTTWTPPGDWNVTDPALDPALPHAGNALSHLGSSVSLLTTALPDSDPQELEDLQAEITSGVAGNATNPEAGSFRDTLIDWGFVPPAP